jgi:ankyrin repeat protein
LAFYYEDENESIESLVERGAGKNQTILIDQIKTAEFHCEPECDKRLLVVIDYFLQNGIDVNAKNEWGSTALMAAAYYGKADIANLLLQRGAKINDKDNFGSTSLQHACWRLNIEVVRLLLENGAEADSKCLYVFYDRDFGIVGDIQIGIECLKLLLNKNIDVNIKYRGKTALMYIVSFFNFDKSKLF